MIKFFAQRRYRPNGTFLNGRSGQQAPVTGDAGTGGVGSGIGDQVEHCAGHLDGRLGMKSGAGFYNYPAPRFQQPNFLKQEARKPKTTN